MPPSGNRTESGYTGTNSSDSGGLLSWLREVRPTLEEFASDPRAFIISTLVLWIIDQIVNFVEATISLLLSTYAMVAGIPGTVGESFGSAGAIISEHAFGVFGTVTDLGLGLIEGLGWAAPLVVAVLFVVFLESVEEVGPPVALAFSNLLGAIPVVGSILDAILTFAIKLAARVGGENS